MSSEIPAREKKPEDDGTKRASQDSQATTHLSPAARISESDVPPAHSSYQITCKAEKDWHDKTKFWAELVGLGFLIAYTIFAGLQWCTMNKTYGEIREQTRKQFSPHLLYENGRIDIANDRRSYTVFIQVKNFVWRQLLFPVNDNHNSR